MGIIYTDDQAATTNPPLVYSRKTKNAPSTCNSVVRGHANNRESTSDEGISYIVDGSFYNAKYTSTYRSKRERSRSSTHKLNGGDWGEIFVFGVCVDGRNFVVTSDMLA